MGEESAVRDVVTWRAVQASSTPLRHRSGEDTQVEGGYLWKDNALLRCTYISCDWSLKSICHHRSISPQNYKSKNSLSIKRKYSSHAVWVFLRKLLVTVDATLFCLCNPVAASAIISHYFSIIFTPSSRLTDPKIVKKFPEVYVTHSFITAIASAHPTAPILNQKSQAHASLYHFFKINFNIILPFTLKSSEWSLSIWSPHQHTICSSPLTHTC